MPSTLQTDDNFDEVEKRFDLKRLKRDLEKKSLHSITDAPWRYFKGVLCVGDPEKVAKRCFKSSGNVRDSLNKYVKPYLLEVLNLPEQRIVWGRVAEWLQDAGYGNLDQKLSLSVNWHQVCCQMWNQQKEKQNIRKKVTAKGFEVNVYVGLGLVQRDYQQRRRGNEHERSQIYGLAEEVIIERYPHDEFLTKVIDADSKKHVAIIGEPGAGKTTLLAAIADHLLEQNSDKVPICFALAGLQQRTIQSYLIDVWLPEAFRLTMRREIESSDQESFRAWMAQGEAWLLLDGVDEMGEAHPASALHQIRTQITDWLGQVRVAVTCRLNVWDAQLINPLEGTFDVFKTQDFEPEQVSDFIQQWFSHSRKPERGEILQAKLNEPQRERIRELVRNPLRLSLLCDVFYTNPDAELPSTKAGLYEQFVRYFYEWKSEQHRTTEPQREHLNAALGKVAIAGLDDKEDLYRFRLPEKAARKVMRNDEFELAEKLGWLNIVDQDADSAQSVYAFFHPTFQEYFAALAVKDADDFLPLNHKNQPTTNRNGEIKYRIFEPQWRESLFIWMECKEISVELKSIFLEKIQNFQEECWIFYKIQTTLLSAILALKIKSSFSDQSKSFTEKWNSSIKSIIKNTTNLGFGVFDIKEKISVKALKCVQKSAKATLLELDRGQVINELIELVNKGIPENDLREVIQFIGKIGKNSSEANDFLIQILHTSGSFWNRALAAGVLLELAPDDQTAMKAVEEHEDVYEITMTVGEPDDNSQSPSFAKMRLDQIFSDQIDSINNLFLLLSTQQDEETYGYLSKRLIEILPRSNFHPAVNKLKACLFCTSPDDNFTQYEAYSEVLWYCAQNMSYPDFYEAWHSPVPDA